MRTFISESARAVGAFPGLRIARRGLTQDPRAEMSVASEYKQQLSVGGSPQITPVLLLILRASC